MVLYTTYKKWWWLGNGLWCCFTMFYPHYHDLCAFRGERPWFWAIATWQTCCWTTKSVVVICCDLMMGWWINRGEFMVMFPGCFTTSFPDFLWRNHEETSNVNAFGGYQRLVLPCFFYFGGWVPEGIHGNQGALGWSVSWGKWLMMMT